MPAASCDQIPQGARAAGTGLGKRPRNIGAIGVKRLQIYMPLGASSEYRKQVKVRGQAANMTYAVTLAWPVLNMHV